MAKIDIEINKFAKAVIKRARGNLSRAKRTASKGLWKSLRYKYAKGELRFYMACYGPFIDQGVSGHGKSTYKAKRPRPVVKSLAGYAFTKGPVGPEAEKSFASWIKGQNIRPRNELGQFIQVTPNSLSSLNFMIRRSVGRFGIPPTRFFSEAVEHYTPLFEKTLDRVIGQSVTDAINETFEQTFTRCKG